MIEQPKINKETVTQFENIYNILDKFIDTCSREELIITISSVLIYASCQGHNIEEFIIKLGRKMAGKCIYNNQTNKTIN